MAVNKQIRSEYIKNLMEDKDELNKSFVETTKETLREIVDEAVNKNLRSLISEADDDNDFEEEEVDSKDLTPSDEELKGDKESADDAADTSDTDTAGGEDEFSEPDVAGGEDEFSEPDTAGDEDEVWSSLEQYKDEDGEYDLTSMASDDVVKVLKVMKPEDGDGVRVIKKDDGNITLIDDENDAEYLIVLDDGEDESYELGESVVNEGNVDLGYTDNYQDKTAMTMDPDDGAKTRKWNAGTPTGNGKRWVGNKGDMSPYNQKVNEGDCDGDECLVEIELEDDMDECGVTEKVETMANGSRTIQDLHHEKNGQPRHDRHRMNGHNAYSEETNESIDKQVNAITNENKQLKQIAGQLKESLNEACVINASLGKIIKLVTENTTTREEKLNIINRFNDVKSVEECKKLYESISEELKRQHPINKGVNEVMGNQQLSESKKTVVETPLYESTELSDTISLMHRLDSIK